MRHQHEAEEKHRQLAQTIRYVSLGLRTAISVGSLSLLYFSLSFYEVQHDDNSGKLNRL